MPKISTKKVFDEMVKVNAKKNDILILKITKPIKDDKAMEYVSDSLEGLSDVLKAHGIETPIILMGPDMDLDMIPESTLEEIGYYKRKVVDEENVDELYK